jgi:hypothetical protein
VDRNLKIAPFSSRGPGSPKTVGKDGFAHRPDLAALGLNTEGAWPAALGDADRTDATLGPIKAISGTSMATPSVAGALALLLIAFGVTEKGAKLDAVVNALMATLVKTGQNGIDDAGDGFLDVEAAYETLYKQFFPGEIPPTAIARYRALQAREKSMEEYLDPMSSANRVAGYPEMSIVSSEVGYLRSTRSAMTKLEIEYPDISHHAAGPLARAWARLTGRAPVPAYVTEYRALSAKIRDNDARRKDYMGRLTGGAGVREELLEHYYQTMAPEFDSDARAMVALLQSHPNAKYEAAGFVGQLVLRLTGRGPRA